VQKIAIWPLIHARNCAQNVCSYFWCKFLGVGVMVGPVDRRQAMKSIVVVVGGVATTLILPSKWTRPVIDSLIVPVNAQGITQTTTAAVTTSNAGTPQLTPTSTLFQPPTTPFINTTIKLSGS
jgi:hypothetical protein